MRSVIEGTMCRWYSITIMSLRALTLSIYIAFESLVGWLEVSWLLVNGWYSFWHFQPRPSSWSFPSWRSMEVNQYRRLRVSRIWKKTEGWRSAQRWTGRDNEIDKLRELRDLSKTFWWGRSAKTAYRVIWIAELSNQSEVSVRSIDLYQLWLAAGREV